MCNKDLTLWESAFGPEVSLTNFDHSVYLSEIYANFEDRMTRTTEQFNAVIARCRDLFEKKMHDYGSAWRILRLPSLTDQIYIKAQRVRSLQEKEERRVDEDESSEFMGIINYAIMALIQLKKGVVQEPDLKVAEALDLFDREVESISKLLEDKNHDYGEAWRDMRISSLTDLILQKLLRVKQIEDNEGKTLVSEGIDANYQDIVNYAVFALIHMEAHQPQKQNTP